MSLFKKTESVPTGGALFSNKALVKLIVPLFIQQVLTVMVGAVDTMMVSDAGEAAVSGVSLVNQLDTFLIIFFTAMVTGGSVVVSQKMGEKKRDDICEAAKQLLYVSTALALILAITVISLRFFILNLLFGAAEADVMSSAQDYFFFVAMSFPFLAVSFSCGACFQAAGNSTIPLTVSLISNVVNIIGNAVCIYVFGLGAMGAAIATLISRIVNSSIQLTLIHRKKHEVHIESLLRYKPDFKIIKRMLGIGIPNGIENAMFQFGRLLTQTLISGLGTSVIAANAVSLTIANFQYMTGTACSSSMVPVVGRCIGAGEVDQAKRYSRKILLINYCTLWTVIAVTAIFVGPLVALYGLEGESAGLAVKLLLSHCAIAALIWPIGFMLPSAFRAAGDVKLPMLVSGSCMWVFRVAGGYVLALSSISVFGLFSIPGL